MTITEQEWNRYIGTLRKLNDTVADKVRTYVDRHGIEDTKQLIDYSYALVTEYGEGAAALSAQMYDVVAEIEGRYLAPAEIAPTASYGEVAKSVNGTIKRSKNSNEIAGAVSRWVKMAGSDTTLQNSIRDGAEFAWIPRGDTCPFCLTLASRGWQRASKKILKNGHAEHIHSNCDCQYAVRFDSKSNVAGYDPDKYKEMYQDADGATPNERINAMRRQQYAQNKDMINAQKRAAYAKRHSGGNSGGHYYKVDGDEGKRGILAAKQYEQYSRVDDSELIANNTGFKVEDIQKIRSHVFFDKHDLDDGYKRFDPDYDMAVAWKRLQDNTYLPRDITLLNHELLENQIEKEYNLSAREAHELTQKKYNWSKQLMDETKGKGEKDGLL